MLQLIQCQYQEWSRCRPCTKLWWPISLKFKVKPTLPCRYIHQIKCVSKQRLTASSMVATCWTTSHLKPVVMVTISLSFPISLSLSLSLSLSVFVSIYICLTSHDLLLISLRFWMIYFGTGATTCDEARRFLISPVSSTILVKNPLWICCHSILLPPLFFQFINFDFSSSFFFLDNPRPLRC